jgi:hypothetical protein
MGGCIFTPLLYIKGGIPGKPIIEPEYNEKYPCNRFVDER